MDLMTVTIHKCHDQVISPIIFLRSVLKFIVHKREGKGSRHFQGRQTTSTLQYEDSMDFHDVPMFSSP